MYQYMLGMSNVPSKNQCPSMYLWILTESVKQTPAEWRIKKKQNIRILRQKNMDIMRKHK